MNENASLSLLERHGWIEPISRQFLEKHPRLKKTLKKQREKSSQGSNDHMDYSVDPKYWEQYKEILISRISDSDIILIHSSMDGLGGLGATAEQCLSFLKGLVKDKHCTIVMPCFPITNLKPPNEKSKPYDPKKTLCWTGMLPNLFIADPECIRTRFPYNSLAAMGIEAEEMMKQDLDASYVYDKKSAWMYCYNHHAKILFLGVKASISNTMAIHMLPDFMGNEWPIEGWYEEKKYRVRLNDTIIEVPVISQRGMWYQYVMEEGTSGRLKRAGLLEEKNIQGCNFGVVEDCHDMLEYLAEDVAKGKLTYLIPHKCYKK